MTSILIEHLKCLAALALALVILPAAIPASAQITTASVVGTIHDSTGLAVPGASITLTSSTKGTSLDATTNQQGDFSFPTVTADTYTVTVKMDGFKTLERPNVVVHPGDRVAVGTLSVEVGSLSETVMVSGEAPLIQAQSGERSFTIPNQTVQNTAINGRVFSSLTNLTPGMVAGTVNGTRSNENNYQVDGVSTVDTGCNCTSSMVSLTVDSVQEVKVLTTNYQSEYGRAAGAQISAVTKSGSQDFHGSLYADRRKDDLNANSWINKRDGLPKTALNQKDYGYTLGGPVGKPGPGAKLFFFFSQEYQPRSASNVITRLHVPSLLERQGDFSQTRDNNGNLLNLIRDPLSGLSCTAANTSGCFQDGGVLGKIPQNRLYAIGLNILNMYPLPNADGGLTTSPSFNWTNVPPNTLSPRRQDLLRVDWQPSASWRFNGKLLQNSGHNSNPGTIPGLLSTLNTVPGNFIPSIAVDGTLNSTTVFEATYGMALNKLGTFSVAGDKINKDALGLTNFPLLYPNANVIPAGSYAASALSNATGWIKNRVINLAPQFVWGSRIANPPPSYNVGQFSATNMAQGASSPFANINRTQDFVASVTKLMGRHTGKAGFYLTHSRKAQTAFGNPSGYVDFSNDTNNPLDTGYGFANAAIGVYDNYTQSSQYLEGNWIYNNAEWYLQDNWKASDRMTLDYGARFYWIQPQYEANGLASNFLPDKFDSSQATRLYYPAFAADGKTRIGIDRVTGATVSAAYIGRLVPNSGNFLNGVFQEGKGIDQHLYQNQGIHIAPRFGFAYDLSGDSRMVVRGGSGIFYNRERGDTVYQTILNPPETVQPTLKYGTLQDLSTTTQLLAPPTLYAFEYDGKIPATIPWNVGVQKVLPWTSTIDLSYVGSYSYNQTDQRNINAPNYGAAFLPQNQDPTLAASATPGATSLPVDFLRPYQGYGDILLMEQKSTVRYNSLQTSFNRRSSKGVSFGLNYTLGKAQGLVSTDLTLVGQLGAPRNDSNQHKANWMPLDYDRRHTLVGNFVWPLPTPGSGLLAAAFGSWQLSGTFTTGSGAPFTVTYSIPGVSAQNLTGAPGLESARIVITGNPGSGHSSDPYKQFNTSAFTTPQTGSIGLESGLNYMRLPPDHTLNLSLSRSLVLNHGRRMEFRVDAFNALNAVITTTINSTLNVTSLTNPTPTNLAEDASGSVVNLRGFGARTAVAAPRTVQLLARFQF
jgi:hypothetical protein